MFSIMRVLLVIFLFSTGFSIQAVARTADAGEIDFFMTPDPGTDTEIAGGRFRTYDQCIAHFGGHSRHCEAFLASNRMTAEECFQQYGNSPMCENLASLRAMTAEECFRQYGNSPMCENLANLNLEGESDVILANNYHSRKQCLRFNPGMISFCTQFNRTSRDHLSQVSGGETSVPAASTQYTEEVLTEL